MSDSVDENDIMWTVDGPATIYPAMGSAIQLTVDLADEDGTITLTAMVPDSGTLGVDPPVKSRKC